MRPSFPFLREQSATCKYLRDVCAAIAHGGPSGSTAGSGGDAPARCVPQCVVNPSEDAYFNASSAVDGSSGRFGLVDIFHVPLSTDDALRWVLEDDILSDGEVPVSSNEEPTSA